MRMKWSWWLDRIGARELMAGMAGRRLLIVDWLDVGKFEGCKDARMGVWKDVREEVTTMEPNA